MRTAPVSSRMTRLRKGYTLVEMLIVISIVSALAGLGTSVILQLLDFNTSVTRHAERKLILDQLEDRFREDVREAVSAQLTPGAAPQLELPQADGTLVVWQFEPEVIRWSRTQGGNRLAGDSFSLSLHEIQFESSGKRAQLRGTLQDGEETQQMSPAERSVIILAELNGPSPVARVGGAP